MHGKTAADWAKTPEIRALILVILKHMLYDCAAKRATVLHDAEPLSSFGNNSNIAFASSAS
jgi:hypothetical protein